MITGTEFTRTRKKTLHSVLVPLGFSEAKRTYFRVRPSGQIHALTLEPVKYGGAFTVDIGIHFNAAPWFDFLFPYMTPNPNEPHAQACFLHRRYTSEDGHAGQPYGRSSKEAASILEGIQVAVLRVFNDFEEVWSSGQQILRLCTPKVLRKDAKTFLEVRNARTREDQIRFSDAMKIRQLFPGWLPHIVPMCLMLSHLAICFGDESLVPEYLRIAQEMPMGNTLEQEYIKALYKNIAQ